MKCRYDFQLEYLFGGDTTVMDPHRICFYPTTGPTFTTVRVFANGRMVRGDTRRALTIEDWRALFRAVEGDAQ